MQKNIELIGQFIESSQCIFALRKIDYPTMLQQNFINCYFQLKQIMRKGHSQTVKVVHTANERDLQNLIVGIIYYSLLNPDNFEEYLKYLQSMKAEGWVIIAKHLRYLVTQAYDQIKSQCKVGIGHLYRQGLYHQCIDESLTTMIIKTIDSYELTQNNLTYTNFMMETFHLIIKNNYHSQFTPNYLQSLSQLLFLKIIRIISTLHLLEDQAIQGLRNKCKVLLFSIWSQFQHQCIVYTHEVLRLCQQLERINEYHQLLQTIKESSKNEQTLDWVREIVVSILLPIRVEKTLLFIKNQKVNSQVVWMELSWMWKEQTRKGQNCNIILVDITRWVTVSTTQIPYKVYILSWVFYTAQNDYAHLQLVKQALFLEWFEKSCPGSSLTTSLHFLAYIINSDIRIAEDLLIYLLRHKQKQFFENRIREAFIQADKEQILKINSIVQNNFISHLIKMEIINLFQSSVDKPPLQYDPSESYQQIDYEQYAPNNTFNQNTNAQPIQNIIQVYKIDLDEQFIEDMQQCLMTIADDPNQDNFNTFMKKLIEVLKQYKKNDQNNIIENRVHQASKLIYLLYNNQFMIFSNRTTQNSLTNKLLKPIISEWRLNTFKSQIHRKIVKKLIQQFPICQLAFWKSFLEINKRSGNPNNKQVADWLIPKDKYPNVLSNLEVFMGSKVSTLYQNANSFQIYRQ